MKVVAHRTVDLLAVLGLVEVHRIAVGVELHTVQVAVEVGVRPK